MRVKYIVFESQARKFVSRTHSLTEKMEDAILFPTFGDAVRFVTGLIERNGKGNCPYKVYSLRA